MKKEYSHDPTKVEQGDTFGDDEYDNEFSGSWQVCGTCFGRIVQPILKGIFYHRVSHSSVLELGNPDHPAIPASPLEQLFEMFCSDSIYDKKKCKHYFHWRDTLGLKLGAGFIGDHWICSDGLTLCGGIFADIIDFKRFKDAETEYPEKQEYKCEKCMAKLVKMKKVIQIPPKGKNKNVIFNRLEWLKK